MGKSKRGFRNHKAGDKRRKKGAGKILPITFGFIIFFVLCLSAFSYIKKWMHDGISEKGISSSERFNYNSGKPNNRQEKIAKEKKTRNSVELAKLPKQKPSIIESDRKIFDKEKPKVVIIVDDLGFKKEPIDKLLEIPAELSFAVLPNLPYSQYAAEMANKNGRDVILHLPMEPTDSSGHAAVDAGEDVLLMGLPKDRILEKLEKNLSSIPYIKGVNNHMGSKFTENAELMELILEKIKGKGLFFVDSKTSLRTTGLQVAKKLRMKAAERDIFLDEGSQRPDYIRSQIENLINVSKEKGYAIGICHPYPDTVKVLSEVIPELNKEVNIVPASRVVNEDFQKYIKQQTSSINHFP